MKHTALVFATMIGISVLALRGWRSRPDHRG